MHGTQRIETRYLRSYFIHPRWAHGPQHPTAMMDAPLVPELYAETTGVPLQHVRQTNRFVQDMTDTLHAQSIFRTGDPETMPHTAFDPTPENGESRLPPSQFNQSTTNRLLHRDLQDIHNMQQASMRQQADRRRAKAKGKGKGKDEGRKGKARCTSLKPSNELWW